MIVQPIPYEECTQWVLKKHYAHRIPSIQYSYGLFEEGQITGIVTYGMPPSPNLCIGVCGEEYKDKVIELNRLCVDSQTKNASSFLVGNSLKLLPPPLIVVSYADTGMGHKGYIYQATNFIYTGITKERTDIYTGRHSRHYVKGVSYPDRQIRTSKHRYVYFVGNKKQVKEMRSFLNYTVMPYPKGETKRYDASAKIPKQGILL